MAKHTKHTIGVLTIKVLSHRALALALAAMLMLMLKWVQPPFTLQWHFAAADALCE